MILPVLEERAMQVSKLCMMGAWGGILLGALTWGRAGILKEPPLPELGNRPAVISRLEGITGGKPISFAVVGDSHGSAVFNQILKELKGKGVDFIVHLGDFAPAPSQEGHALFLEQVKENLGPKAPPMLLVMGNHDVDLGFPVQAFEGLYGPSSFSFRIGGNLFVVVRNCLPRSLRGAGNTTKGWGEEVRRVIQEKGYGARRTFLFMHAPPMDPLSPVRTAGASRFEAKWGGLGVDYILAGHLHQYSRTQIGSTVVLVSGGGGGTLRMVRSGRFHHALIFRVTEDQVTEELVAVEKPWAPLWRLQRASVLGLSSLLSFLRGERGSAISMVSKAEKAISPGAGGSSFPWGAAHLR
jgi:predicted phosphodiesterase